MQLLLEKVASYGFNRRCMTERDFFEICENEGITVIWSDYSYSWYMVVDGEPFIVLAKRRRGLKLLYTMFHELAHHFWHVGDELNVIFFEGLVDSKDELEADTLAMVAILPIVLQTEDFIREFLEENHTRFARKLVEDRKRLNFFDQV